MDLSLMSFSMMKDAVLWRVSAETLTATARECGINSMDLMDFEVGLYGENKLLAAMRKQGVSCGCIIANLPLYHAPKKVEAKLKKAIELTKRMGANLLMIVPGPTGLDRSACRKLSRQEMLDRAVQYYSLAVETGRQYGIQIGFENTPADYKPLCSAEDCRYLLDKVPGLGFIFDTGNFRVADTKADELAAYELLKDRIVRVHLKDVVIGPFRRGEVCADGDRIQTVTTGSGAIPMGELIRRFRDDGYTGTFTVEYAAMPNASKGDHAKWIKPYVSFIQNAYADSELKPPYGRIEGLEKPVSRLFFGTAIKPMLLGRNVNALLDAVLACGVNAFDCARGYGLAEKSLGTWMKDRNNREKVVLLTKCGNADLKGQVHINREVIESQLKKSLAALQTDYIDIYLLHRDDPKTSAGEIMECLNEAKRSGKIRVFGVSNWTHHRIEEANRYAREHGLDGFSVSSPNFGLTRQIQDPWGGDCVSISGPENKAARDWYGSNQMPVIAYSSLGRGFFSGKFRSGDYVGAEKVLDIAARKGYLYEENMKRLHNAEAIAERDHCSVPQVAMRYVFSSPMNVFAVVSTTDPARMKQNIEAAHMPFNDEDVDALENDK